MDGDKKAFIVVDKDESAIGEPITFSEKDIENLILSKAALYTIINILTRHYGVSVYEIEKFYVAGNFGSHIDPESAINIGMLPEIPLNRFIDIGNASGAGAVYLLLSKEAIAEVEEICKKLFYLEMNVEQTFMSELTAGLFLPHTNREIFPKTWERLEALKE